MFQSLGALTGVQWTSAVTVSALAMAGMCQNEAGVQQGWRKFFSAKGHLGQGRQKTYKLGGT